MDFELAAKISGSRFVMLKGAVARIHRALAQFMIDTHVDENGLVEMNSPVLVRDEAGKTRRVPAPAGPPLLLPEKALPSGSAALAVPGRPLRLDRNSSSKPLRTHVRS